MSEANIWATILDRLRGDIDPEEFRRWFSNSSYASDSGDQISVWVSSAAEGRHILQNYADRIQRELTRWAGPTPRSASSPPATRTKKTRIRTTSEKTVITQRPRELGARGSWT